MVYIERIGRILFIYSIDVVLVREKRMTKPGFEPGTSPDLVRACYHYTTRPFSWRDHQLQQFSPYEEL